MLHRMNGGKAQRLCQDEGPLQERRSPAEEREKWQWLMVLGQIGMGERLRVTPTPPETRGWEPWLEEMKVTCQVLQKGRVYH